MLCKTIGGMKVWIREGTSDQVVADDNLGRHSYEWKFPILPTETWLDIGGYIGTFALRVLQVGAEVLSYEPTPDTLLMYKKNILENGFTPKVFGRAVAQYPKSPTVDLCLNHLKGNYAANTIFQRWKRERETIKVPIDAFTVALKRLHTAFPDRSSYCLKIDAEGVEIEILEALRNSIFTKIVGEYHFGIDPSLNRLRGIKRRLEGLGYTVWIKDKLPPMANWEVKRKITTTFFAEMR